MKKRAAVGRTYTATDAMAITGLHHVQLAMPRGGEDEARSFYVDVLGFEEVQNRRISRDAEECGFGPAGRKSTSAWKTISGRPARLTRPSWWRIWPGW
jgi:catechol 2,3-dioxygenase-like lactoylglutathione lyase family enzyme